MNILSNIQRYSCIFGISFYMLSFTVSLLFIIDLIPSPSIKLAVNAFYAYAVF